METWKCDGENDCWDMSDEANCTSIAKLECAVGQFRCANGHCISEKWHCDSEDDCLDGEPGKLSSDEIDCDIRCKYNEFKCDNTCLPSTWECDASADCQDGSDEGDHCAYRNCSEHMFKCKSSGKCISKAWVCDGDADCSEGEDELSSECSITVTGIGHCPPSSFSCSNGDCIESAYVCDGDADCAEGEDEYEDCEWSPLAHPNCTADQFRCYNQACISKNLTCDSVNDCKDGSDESPDLCRNSTKVCSPPEFFRCNTGACVRASQLCDGRNDCMDYSDEASCGVNECLLSNMCQHKCIDLKIGYECACHPGYEVSPNNPNACRDVNECETIHPCTQICINTIGSYHCSCKDGYLLKDKHVCKATSNETTKLIFSNRYYIRQVNMAGNSSILIHQLSNAVALDFEWKTKCLYWSDVTSELSTIKRQCGDENRTTLLHHSMLKNPDGLAVDWVAGNLYWCDKGLDTIEVSKLDGKYQKVLINKNLREPRAIAVDPFRRNIYWSDWGDSPYIGKAGMDGSNRKVIIRDKLGWPNALTISFETNELYWGDAREDFIAVSDLDGNNPRELLSRRTNPSLNLHHIFAIAVWEDRVYWTDWETKSIEYCNKHDGQNCSKLTTTIHRPMDLRVYHPYRQREIPNPCENANCSTLCVLSPDPPYYKCLCPENFVLESDGRSCRANCTPAHFQCASTYKCIPFYWKCDTQDDCGDRSDEHENCPKFVCEIGQYQCANSKCIHPRQICDGKNQCGDNSDELDCDQFTCFENDIKCGKSENSSAFCLDSSKKCDGQRNCPNGEDELECSKINCTANQFQCGSGSCIPLVWVCDGDTDCSDQSDEMSCGNRVCGTTEFK